MFFNICWGKICSKLSEKNYRAISSKQPKVEDYQVFSNGEHCQTSPSKEDYRVSPSKEDYRVSPSEENYQVSPSEENYRVSPSGEDYRVSPTEENYRVSPKEEDYRVSPSEENYRVFPSEEDYRVSSDDHQKVADLLCKLYPGWAGILQALDDRAELMDAMVLLSYIDCACPRLFLTQDDMFGVRWKTKAHHDELASEECRDETTERISTKETQSDGTAVSDRSKHYTDGSTTLIKEQSPPGGTSFRYQSTDGRSSEEPLSRPLGVAPLENITSGGSSTQKEPPTPPPDGLPADGIPIQLRVDAARQELSGDYGDVALILNGFYGWSERSQEQRDAWAERLRIDTDEMGVLWRAFRDLLALIERETGVEVESWVTPPKMQSGTMGARLRGWAARMVERCPGMVYLHTGVPGHEYMNLMTGAVEPCYLRRNFNFDTSPVPPEFLISLPCYTCRTPGFRSDEPFNLLTMPGDPGLLSEICSKLYPEALAERLEERAVEVAVISDIGVALMRILTDQQQSRITDMEHDISVQCGVAHVLVHVQVNTLRSRLHVFTPAGHAHKAHQVARYHVEVARSRVESEAVELRAYPEESTESGPKTTPGRVVSLGAGGVLHGLKYQDPLASRTALIHALTTQQNRAHTLPKPGRGNYANHAPSQRYQQR